MNLYAKILIGINEGQTLFVKDFNPSTGVILVNTNGNNYVYANGEYEKKDVYPNAWDKAVKGGK